MSEEELRTIVARLDEAKQDAAGRADFMTACLFRDAAHPLRKMIKAAEEKRFFEESWGKGESDPNNEV